MRSVLRRSTRTRARVHVLAAAPASWQPRAHASSASARDERGVSRLQYWRQGSGGRSSVSGIVATVFGSTGFLGRYVVSNLGRVGSQVVVPRRGNEDDTRHLKVLGDLGQIVPLDYSIRDRASIERAVAHSNVVINLVGAYRPTMNFSMDDANHKAAKLIARVSAEAGVERLIHVGALGSDVNSPSTFLRTKALGEEGVRDIFPNATIIRPAPLFGAEDRVLTRIGHILTSWPFVPMVCRDSKIQPLSVNDCAKAILGAINAEESKGGTYDLAGPTVFTQEQLVDFVAELTLRPARKVSIPHSWLKAFARVSQKLRNPRYSEAEVEMLLHDRVADAQAQQHTLDALRLSRLESLEQGSTLFMRHFRIHRHMNLLIEPRKV